MGFQTNIQLIFVLISVTVTYGQDRIEAPTYKAVDAVISMCNKSACIRHEQKELNARYGVFTTMDKHLKDTRMKYTDIDRVYAVQLFKSRPGCSCCTTNQYHTYYRTLNNISGQRCYIIQLPYLGMYQFSTVGRCGNYNMCIGGRCQQSYAYITLLAWCPSSGSNLKFELFRIPSHCACKQNINVFHQPLEKMRGRSFGPNINI